MSIRPVIATSAATPIAWHGPIVMNTKEEIRQAIGDLNNNQFIKPQHEHWITNGTFG